MNSPTPECAKWLHHKAQWRTLRDVGFRPELALDLTQRGFDEAVDRFLGVLQPGATAVVFYAGHGIRIDGVNYLLPVDYDARDAGEVRSKAAYQQIFCTTKLLRRASACKS